MIAYCCNVYGLRAVNWNIFRKKLPWLISRQYSRTFLEINTELNYNKTGNLHINVAMSLVRVTIVAMEKQ
jgi:hypothetical protein